MKIKDTPHTCTHCGNTGVLSYISEFDTPEEVIHRDFYGNVIDYSLVENTTWYLFKCPVCGNPVLLSEYTCQGMPDDYSELTTEYPSVKVHFDGVPSNIKTAYKSAIKTKGIDKAICLLSLRRTLEMICKDKGGKGKDLEAKIAYLIDEKLLPEMMRDACWVVRQNGNDAAHGDNIEFSAFEVEEVIEYVGAVIDYLYSMPVRVEKLRKRIEERKNKASARG